MRSHVDDYGAVKLDAEGNIRLDLPCVQCAYNLRGLDPQSTCPECGLPISGSLGLSSGPSPWLVVFLPFVLINAVLFALSLITDIHSYVHGLIVLVSVALLVANAIYTYKDRGFPCVVALLANMIITAMCAMVIH